MTAPAAKKRLLTGDRPTGPLHLGHLVGTLHNRVAMQDDHDCWLIVADLHSLTTRSRREQIGELPELVHEVVLDLLVNSHPTTQSRKGPVDDAHPDGVYPVEPGSIPMTLADLATKFESLAERFGAWRRVVTLCRALHSGLREPLSLPARGGAVLQAVALADCPAR